MMFALAASKEQDSNREEGSTYGLPSQLTKYIPLVVTVLISVGAGAALAFGSAPVSVSIGQGMQFMHFFMGTFLVIFSMLKLYDLKGFQEGFSMYDIGAKRFKTYGYVYPFLELALGLAYLSFTLPVLTYLLTGLLLGFGAYGVFRALSEGLDTACACMGTVQ